MLKVRNISTLKNVLEPKFSTLPPFRKRIITDINTYTKAKIEAKNFLEVIAYFDIFNHPLTKEEVGNLSDSSSLDYVFNEMTELVRSKKCYEYKGFYSLRKEVEELVGNRLKKEKEAEKYIKKLPFFVGLISKFPFVRGIAISGSLSKGVMYADGDIDYFIITAADRLWICRSLLVGFKKIFLLNSKKYFCVNYFVDENNLEIIDKNIFTAVELAYLFPVFNEELINQLKAKNKWIKAYFPKFKHPLQSTFNVRKKKKYKGFEIVFNKGWSDKIDLWLMKVTFKRWEKKFEHFDSKKFELTMRTNRGVSKHHPQDFQNKVLTGVEQRMSKFRG